MAGRLTRDPELRALPSGQQVAGFGLAINRVYYDKNDKKVEQVEFVNIVAFGKAADTIGEYCRKGDCLFVEGRMQTREWEAADGSKRRNSEIVLESFQFGQKAKENQGYDNDRGNDRPASRPARRQERYDDGQGDEEAKADPEPARSRPAAMYGRKTTQAALKKGIDRYSRPAREVPSDEIPVIEEEEGTRGKEPDSIMNDENDDIDVSKIPF